jgi:hypothetical protein
MHHKSMTKCWAIKKEQKIQVNKFKIRHQMLIIQKVQLQNRKRNDESMIFIM